jgi:hypothetical protein
MKRLAISAFAPGDTATTKCKKGDEGRLGDARLDH